MKKYTGTFRTIQTIKADDGSLPTEIEVLPMGEWNTIPYGPFKVTAEHFRQMVANFNAGIRKDVPVDVDHDGGRAAAWIKDLFAAGDRLMAKLEWTPYGEELVKGKIYKLFSPEFSLNYVDPEYSTDHGAVFIAGSLTNRPLFKELSYITASEKPLTSDSGVVLLFSQASMNLEELKTKTKEELTTEEVEFLKENVEQLSDEEKAKFELIEETPEAKAEAQAKADAEAKAKAEADAQAEADAKAKTEEEAKKANDSVTISASELAELRAKAEVGTKASEELTKKNAEELIQTFVANDKGGKILPKNKDAFVDFYLKCSDEQKPVFEGLLKSLSEVMVAGEVGKSDESAAGSAYDQIEAKIVEKIKASEDKLDRASATKMVREENKELYEQYKIELKEK